MEKKRCEWANGKNPEMVRYHDNEWGVPAFDDRVLFEFLVLEGAQAGLSWETILNKRKGYRKVFSGFSPEKIAKFSNAKLDSILGVPDIVRNRAKVYSVRVNARAFLRVQKEYGSFSKYFWNFTRGKALQHSFRSSKEIPSETPLSQEISKDLKIRGFTFVGPTICYAFMQAVGMVNDHETGCFRYTQAREERK